MKSVCGDCVSTRPKGYAYPGIGEESSGRDPCCKLQATGTRQTLQGRTASRQSLYFARQVTRDIPHLRGLALLSSTDARISLLLGAWTPLLIDVYDARARHQADSLAAHLTRKKEEATRLLAEKVANEVDDDICGGERQVFVLRALPFHRRID